jgi:hypothetical protein
METYATETGGKYTNVNPTKLHEIEQTITATSGETPYLSAAAATGTGGGYTLTVTSPSTSNTFTIARAEGSGVPTFSCTVPGKGGCPPGAGDWSK